MATASIRGALMEFNLMHGDCLDLMATIPDGSVDMVLCDLPYGVTNIKWDSVIPFEQLWAHYWRVLKKNGAVVLTAAQPFTTQIIASQIEFFKYCWYWEKSSPGGFAQAKNMPLKTVEDVVVFSKGTATHVSQSKNRMTYNPQGLIHSPKTVKNRKRDNSGFESAFGDRPSHQNQYVQEFTNYPKQVLRFDTDRGLHPTQKPVALMEYLIKTYTNEGETVLDNCAGSFTTGVACVNLNRKFIGIEMDRNYFDIGVNRIKERIKCLDLKIEPMISMED